MKLLKKIMVATDFSLSSDHAFRRALKTAEQFDSELHLVHVIPDLSGSAYSGTAVRKMVDAQAEKYLEEAKKSGVTADVTVFDDGSLTQRILDFADFNDVNVIFAGAGDNALSDPSRLGLTAERLAMRATKPVWIEKGGSDPGLNSILCPVDFSESSRRALKNALLLCRKLDAELSIVLVIPKLSSLLAFMVKSETEAEKKEFEEQQQSKFDEFISGLDFSGIRWSKEIRHGKPEEEIAAAVRSKGAGLLILGFQETRTGRGILLSQAAEKVLRHSPCSTIVIKQEEPIKVQFDDELYDTEDHMSRGYQLLENGLAEDALRHFEYCADKHILSIPAWKGIVEANERLGNQEESENGRKKIDAIRKKLWAAQVEAEIRDKKKF